MAQMFRMMNYNHAASGTRGYISCLNRSFPYKYQFTMMLEEIRVLSKLEVSDRESFEERSSFFTKDVVVATCKDYIQNLKTYIESRKTKRCQGRPYKTVKGKHYFVDEINNKVRGPIKNALIKEFEKWVETDFKKYQQAFEIKTVNNTLVSDFITELGEILHNCNYNFKTVCDYEPLNNQGIFNIETNWCN
jgi:hypothetical protein